MPQHTVGEAHPSRGSWVFCVLNHDGCRSNIFLSAEEADAIVDWVRKLGMMQPDFLRPEFWREKGEGKCRVGKIYKALPRNPIGGTKRRKSYSSFEAKAKRRCLGSCPNGPCIEILDPVTRTLKDCKDSEA